MNILDLIVIVALAVALVNGWCKGFIRKLFSLAGLVGGIWLAFGCGVRCGSAIGLTGSAATIVGPLLLFIATVIFANLAGRLIAKASDTVGLGSVDTLLGIALALVQGVLLLGLLFKATDYLAPTLIPRETRAGSKCYARVDALSDTVFPVLTQFAEEFLPPLPEMERLRPADEELQTDEKIRTA